MGSKISRLYGTSFSSKDHGSNLSPPECHDSELQDRRGAREGNCNYNYLEQVPGFLELAGIDPNLILGIDFTKSNEWKGKKSFNRRSLHCIGENPFEEAISIMGRTISAVDMDKKISCFGFGDVTTLDEDVFTFYPNQRPCVGFDEVLPRYREIVPHLRLAEPTSFAPIIEIATAMVEKSGGQYHVLLIITDGQVLSGHPQKKMTLDTIARASTYPLFVILIGVGDGPWNMMKEFAKKKIPDRVVDNIQFVNFTEIMSSNNHNKEIEFAQAALIGIRGHYEEAVRLDLLGHQKLQAQTRAPLRPPLPVPDSIRNSINLLLCPICLTNSKDLAFGCGHQTCSQCGQGLLLSCPICRSRIDTRIKLYYHMC